MEEDSKLEAKLFDVSEPLMIMYNDIDDLQDLAVAAKKSFSEQ